MAFQSFHTGVRFVVGDDTFDVRVQSLTAGKKPVALAGDIAVELFDGRKRQRVDGYRLTLDLSWTQMDGASNETLHDAALAILDAGGCDVLLDPTKDPAASGGGQKQMPGMILTDAASAVEASFNMMVRSRPASISLESDRLLTRSEAGSYKWLTSTLA